MRDNKLRAWFAPEDIQGGQKTHEQLEHAVQVHDRLLIVLSEESMKSEWVMTEIRNARQAELKENRRKLFPIRLVAFDAIRKWKCFDADTGKDLAVEKHLFLDTLTVSEKVPVFMELRDRNNNETEQSLLDFIQDTLTANQFGLDREYFEKR